MKHRFLPLRLHHGNRAKLEREFNRSLSNLCTRYGLQMPGLHGQPFPLNIYETIQAVGTQVSEIHPHTSCIILAGRGKQATVATVTTVGIGYCLFYIPVRPLWHWVQCARMQHLAPLVMGIFAYLVQVAKIPFFGEPGTYLGGQYEMLSQWLMEIAYDEEEAGEPNREYREAQENDIADLQQAGYSLWQELPKPHWLAELEIQVGIFQPVNETEQEWLAMGTDWLQLYRDYPTLNVNSSVHPELYHPEEEDRVTPEHYTGIYWSNRDNLIDDLETMINNQLQEMAVLDEPIQVQVYDTLQESDTTEMAYSQRLFDLIEKLRDLMTAQDHYTP